jgi:hypothetical protein
MTPRRILLKPYSVNGTGVRLLDYRAVAPGVYEVTRWLTLFFIPLVPISTWIIRPGTTEDNGLSTEFSYQILDTRPLSLTAVARKYALTALAVLPFFALLTLASPGQMPKWLELTLVLLSVAWFLGLLLHGERAGAHVYSSPAEQPIPSGGDAPTSRRG